MDVHKSFVSINIKKEIEESYYKNEKLISEK